MDGKANVCVIGAGIAGLVTAKTLAEDGFDVLVLERDSNLGGTWAPARTYPGLRTNNSKYTYAYSDFPYPDSADTFPRAEQVRAYLESYADRFGVRARIRFNQEVTSVSRLSGDPERASVTFRSTEGETGETTSAFDFVVICNGVFHVPNVPEIEGMDAFEGRIMHSIDVRKSTYQPNEKVIVVGGAKSAFDCAAWAARQGLSPTLLFRRPQWMAPRYLPGGSPGDLMFISRFMSFFIRYYHPGRFERVLRWVASPLIWLWWKFLSFLWPTVLKTPKVLRPAESLPDGVEKSAVGGDLYAAVNDGSAGAIHGSIARFVADGVVLDGGETLAADTVVFATGFGQTMSFLSDELRSEIAGAGYPRLFRQILPPTVPHITFNGYASSFACQMTSELGAHWLSEHFHGTLKQPSIVEMNEDIDRAHAWANRYMPQRGTEGFIGPHITVYVDDLLADLGLEKRRTDSLFEEYLTAFRPSRFAGVGDERRRARAASGA